MGKLATLFLALVLASALAGPPRVHAEEMGVLTEGFAAGEIVQVSPDSSSIQIRDEKGALVQLGVEPYTTIIWKNNAYADDAGVLEPGDRVKAGYFSEGEKTLAGWIDVVR